MSVKDWVATIAAAVVVLSALGNLYVSVRMRDRDREDFEDFRNETRDDVKGLQELVGKIREDVGELKGRKS